MIEKFLMWSMLRCSSVELVAQTKRAWPFQRKLISRSDVKGRRPVLKLKKRHVERLTRLPTKRLATACWDFIVVKTAGLQTAPLLDFSSLQPANTKIHKQVIHKVLWMSWGQFHRPFVVVRIGKNSPTMAPDSSDWQEQSIESKECKRSPTLKAWHRRRRSRQSRLSRLPRCGKTQRATGLQINATAE
jgi:hypothetical protein